MASSMIVSSFWLNWQSPLPSFAQSPLAPPSGAITFPTPVIGDIYYEAQYPNPPTPTPTRIPDNDPPETAIVLEHPPNSQNWYRTPVTFTFVATDTWTGLGITWHKLSHETVWNRYEYYFPPAVVITEGTHILEYYSQDKNFNTELTQTTTINLDLTSPTVTHTLDGTFAPEGWYSSPVTITLTGQDNLSGIDHYEMNLNDSGWFTTTSLTINEPDHYSLSYRAFDQADNISPAETITFTITGWFALEAEEPDTNISRNGQSWSVLSQLSNYSGSGYLKIGLDQDILYPESEVNTAPEVQYDLDVTITGTYHLWLRGSGANGAGDSIHAALAPLGQSPGDKVSMSGFWPNQWNWTQQTLTGPLATVNVDTPGPHILYIWPREDGVRLDRLILTTDGNYTP
jgi:hypothetical protein